MQSNNDEVPIGGGNKGGQNFEDEFAPTNQEETKDSNQPIEERLVSKTWIIRAKAFEELNTLFKGSKGQTDQVFSDHMGMWKKYLADSNPGALEKCLEALNSFINLAEEKVVAISQNDIVKLLIEKCIGQPKPTIRQKSLECFNLLFEVTESFDDSIEVSLAAQATLNSWISNYGAKKVQVKSFLKIAETNANSSNPTVRSETMNFYKECYKWLGDGLKPLIQENLKKQQMDDLEKAFEEIKDKPKNQRLTRSEKKKEKENQASGQIKQEEEEKSASNVAYDLAEPKNILDTFNPEWQDKLGELKKWNEKKELLEQFLTASSVPKLQDGDYIGLISILKKLLGDSNQVVSTLAIKACGNLAKGLQKNFEPYCKELVPVLIQKFKEKRTSTIEETHDVLNQIAQCTSLENLQEELSAGIIVTATPTVKKNTCIYLEKFIKITYIDVLQRCSPEFIEHLMKSTDVQDGEIRDAALSVLGIFKGRLGEATMSKYVQDLNPQKLAKVNESSQTVQPSKYDKPEKKKEPPPLKSRQSPAKKAPVKKKEEEKKEVVEEQKVEKEDVIMKGQENDAMDERPIGGGNKGNNFDEQPIGGGNKGNNFDEQPIGGGKKGNNFDDMPIGGGNKGNTFDDMPIGGAKGNAFEEQPIGGGNNGGADEQPLGGGNKGFSAYNLDNLEALEQQMMAEQARQKALPKKAPAKKKNIDEDTTMNTEKEEVKEVKKPPVKKEKPAASKEESKKPAANKGKAAAGGQDDDVGAGLSKEEAEAKVEETFNEESVGLMKESKWQDKVEGFKGIGEQIIELQPSQDVIEALAKFVKSKMKDWKESNVNLIKECIALFLVIAQNCEKVNRRAVACLMPFLTEKLGDIKVTNQTNELCMALAELVSPKFIGLQIIKHGSTAKSPKVLQEACNILTKLCEEFGANQMALKEMIDFGNIQVSHSNPQVRTSAMNLFSIMYKHVGESIKNFLKDIKESTMKLIEAEFAKITPLKKGEFQGKRGLRGEAAEEVKEAKGGKGGGGGLDSLPREDISKQLTPKLIAMCKNSDWKVRKEAADKVEEMLKAANMRIQPVGLNELIDNIKQKMTDPNKAVLKAYLQLVCQLVEALGPGAKGYSKKLLPPILQNLADKQSLVRGDTILCMDKWAENTSPENVINHLGPLLVQENPELRNEGLTWITKRKESIKQCDCKELVKPFLSCLNDKAPSIRNLAEALATDIMSVTGYGAFKSVQDDFKPAVQNALKPILEKMKKNAGATANDNAAPNNLNSSIGNNRPQTAQIEKKDATKKNQIGGRPQTAVKEEPTLKQQPEQKKQQQIPSNNKTLGRSESKEPVMKPTLKPSALAQMQSAQQKEQQQAQEEVYLINNSQALREKRIEYDKKNKWVQEELKADQLDKLKTWTNQVFGGVIAQKMFSNDFKQHNECIDLFAKWNETNEEAFKDNLDLVFKWSLVKMGENSNTQFALKLFDFFSSLFDYYLQNQMQLSDQEANVLFPMLCEKTGLNNNILKDKVKKIIRVVIMMYDKQRCHQMLVIYGLQSKNTRTSAECLDELAEFIKLYGTDYSAEKDVKLVAKMADSSDKGIRENSLKVMNEVYKIFGDNIWRIIGDVTPKVLGLFQQRFKKTQVGLSQSSSQANIQLSQQQESDANMQSPNSSLKFQKKTGTGIPLQKNTSANANIGNSKTITPRNNLTMNKIGKGQSSDNMNNVLSKSINQFNNTGQSEEIKKENPLKFQKRESLREPRADNQLIQSQTQQPVKRMIPQSQRQETSGGGLSKFAKKNSDQNQLMGSLQKESPYQQQQKNQETFQKSIGGSSMKTDEDVEMLADDAPQNEDPIQQEEDQEFKRQQEDIIKHINQLKYGDLSKRVDSLVSLNELISQVESNKSALIQTGNDLINAFTHVLMDIFERSLEEIPLRFAKYFITIVLKACSCKEIMKEVSEERIFELAEQLLTRLLIENLDKIGENKEGELILKNLNSSMLRLLENCNHTYIFCVLFNLLRKYKDYNQLPKLPGLIIKCLLKLSKILEKLIDKLDMEKILLAIHEYLVVVNHENKTQNDEMGIRIVKTVINELVKLKKESIMEAYNLTIVNHPQQDHHILRWIQIIMKSLSSNQSTTNSNTNSASQGGMNMTGGSVEVEIRQLVDELRDSEQFEKTIPKLHIFLENNPEVDLNYYLQECSKTFQQFIRSNLEKYKSNINEESKDGDQLGMGMMDSMKSTNNSDGSKDIQNQSDKEGMSNSNRINEYQNKLTSIKQRFNQKSSSKGDNAHTSKDQNTHNLNTSFSAMNTSLQQKWHEINKKNAVTKRESAQNQQQLSSTMGGFGGGNQGANTLAQKSSNLNMSSGVGATADGEQQNTQGATNQDLNKRLAEMKAKLQALKKK